MEKEFLEPGPVLDEDGCPIPGFSRKSLLQYDRKKVKAWPWRMKEWDFYQISNDHLCLQFTIGHVGYAGQVCINLFDFRTGERHVSQGRLLPLVFGSLHMPLDAERENCLFYQKDDVYMCFETKSMEQGNERVLRCRWKDLEAEMVLKRVNQDSIVVNIPFEESKHAFYYNHKINCMTAEGFVRTKEQEWQFEKKNSFAVLDWGRGVWPFHNEWYWSNGTGMVNGEIFGFNLGCGFGNTENASENMVFYRGRSHKLGKVKFELGKDHSQPWQLIEENGRMNLTLNPDYDNLTVTRILWVNNCCHQMFGRFNGTVTLDDGEVLEIRDLTAFAEHAVNNW